MRGVVLASTLCVLALACRKPLPSDASGSGAASASVAAKAAPSPSASIGSTLTVKARHESGVPVHAAPSSGAVIARLSDESAVRLEGQSADARWYDVSQGNVRGWVTRRYLPGLPSPGEAPASVLAGESPFVSREACAAALAAGKRQPRGSGQARIASWNLHWFPDGKPGKGASAEGEGSDAEWLGCVLSWLDAPVVALQEVKLTLRAQATMAGLLATLTRHTRGNWQIALDDCPDNFGQHLAVLYDEKRVKKLSSATVAELNPHGSPCKDQLRPGLDLYLRFQGGLDLHVITAHLKAGGERRDYELRQRSFSAFSDAYARAQRLFADPDVLVIGDLNTMGCPDCSPAVEQESELALLDENLAGEGFQRLHPDQACSMYYGERGALLDGAAASLGFRELGRHPALHVSGLCAELACRRATRRLAAHERLSDHCPVYVDIDDQDRD